MGKKGKNNSSYPYYNGGTPTIYNYNTPTKVTSTTSAWGNWNWGSWGGGYSFDSIEEKMKRKKVIKAELDKFKDKYGIIAKTNIGGSLLLNRRSSIYSISIPNNAEYKESIKLLHEKMSIWKKFPRTVAINRHKNLVSEFVDAHQLSWEHGLGAYAAAFFRGSDISGDEIKDRVDKMYSIMNSSIITEQEFQTLVALIPSSRVKELNEGNPEGRGGVSSGESGRPVDRIDSKVSITLPPLKKVKEASLTRGRRINRGYINNTDYKCLTKVEYDKSEKTKLLILLDASGSMNSSENGGPTFHHIAINFSAQLQQTNAFDIEMIHTDSNRVADVTQDIKNFASKKDDNFLSTRGSEGFEVLTDRLGHLSRKEDYVLVMTDMSVPANAEDNLRNFIGNKKHMILSFGKEKQFQGLNVRYVKTVTQMRDVITTLLG